jgi:hypothetical protein
MPLLLYSASTPNGPTKQDYSMKNRFGPGWEKAGAGKREDNSVHVCLSRAGLLYGCNHYLTHGAEVDQHIAQALFPGDSGLDLLARAPCEDRQFYGPLP